MKKRLTAIILSTLVLTSTLLGCGTPSNESEKNASSDDKKTIVVGATPVPHAEILNDVVKPILEKEGYTLKVKVFTDYVQPNVALQEGDLDANFFQHVPFLEKFNKENNADLVATVKVHLEPLGLYSHKIKSLDEIKDGDEISIPNDPTNESRALRLLEENGLIKLNDNELVNKFDITENKKNIKINELDAAQLSRTLDDVTASIINTNFALQADLNPLEDAIIIESKDSPYSNIVAVKNGDQDKAYIKALNEAITSEEVRKYIEEKYKGSIIPSF